MFEEPEPEESSRSPLTDCSLSACVCVYACQDNCLQGAPECFALSSSLWGSAVFALGNVPQRQHLKFFMYIACYLKHVAACMSCTPDSVSQYLHV